MRRLDLRGRSVLVTGASSGLGLEMARVLARTYGAHPILVARRRDRLDALAAELAAHGVRPRVIVADLSRPEDVERVFAESTAGGDVHAVILNAGVTYFGPHAELSRAAYDALVATNLTSVVRLTDAFVPYLLARGQGGAIMLVSSVAGFLPTPYQAAYSGAKAFVTHFGMSLAEELHGQNVSLTVFSPGGIATEMNHISGLAAQFDGSVLLQSAEVCARDGLHAMVARRKLFVPGWLNRVQLFFSRFVPRGLQMTIARKAFEKALRAKLRG